MGMGMGRQLEQHHSSCATGMLQPKPAGVSSNHQNTGLLKHRVLMDLLFHLWDNRLRHCCCMDLVTMLSLLPAPPGTRVATSCCCRCWVSPCSSFPLSIQPQDQGSSQWPWSLGQHTRPLLPHPTTATSFAVWPFRNLNGTHNI